MHETFRSRGLGNPARVAAVIPALNEAGAIGATVARVPRDVIDTVIVVDGNSTDGTVAAAQAAGAEVLIQTLPGYGRACATGARRAQDIGADIVLLMDGDGSDVVEQCAQLIAPVVAGTSDFVMATRTRGSREAGSMGVHQIIAGHLIGRTVGIVCGVRYSDMCAFRAIRLDTLMWLGMQEMTYGWNLEMQMRAALMGLRVQEVPLPYRRRVAGISKVSGNLAGSVRAGAHILATLVRVSLQARTGRTAS